MSKNIVIEKAGVPQTLTGTEEIKTSKVDSGSVSWVPEDETVLTELTVTQNGTYQPGAGVYGFSKVTVNVQIVTGTMDGKTYQVTLDANGYLVFTEIQS